MFFVNKRNNNAVNSVNIAISETNIIDISFQRQITQKNLKLTEPSHLKTNVYRRLTFT